MGVPATRRSVAKTTIGKFIVVKRRMSDVFRFFRMILFVVKQAGCFLVSEHCCQWSGNRPV